jgi:hypothetical protein
MAKFEHWQSGTAVLLVLGLMTGTAAPALMPAPAVAQLFPQSNQIRIPAGTLIPATYKDAERIVLKPDETLPLKLTITRNITSSMGTILIPEGSQIEGQLEPVEGGTQFVAKELVIKNGRRMDLSATSRVITRKEEITKGASTSSILKGALIGGAAAAVISEIFGSVGILKVLGGAGAGAVGGLLLGRKKTEVMVVDPKTDLDLTLNSDLRLG